MAYGIRYNCYFDPFGEDQSDPLYTLQILQKDFVGDAIAISASAIPVIHSWNTDDPKAPIKGSSLSINLLNENGSLPLDTFFSINDDEFKVEFYWDNGGPQLMFAGFLVQDDCSETLVDYKHEINLSANDNLGLLKDVALDKANIQYQTIGSINDMWSTTAPHTVTIPSGALADNVTAGDVLHIHSLIFDVDYTVNDISGNPNFIVNETVTTGSTGTSDDITLLRPILFADKITILEVIKNCLAATNLELETDIFCNFEEVAMDPSVSFMEQTLHDPQTWLKDATLYDDCYTILEKIMRRFRCTLFQAKGVWNIVHWDELRYSGYPIPGYAYDPDFVLIGPVKLNHESMIFAGFSKFNIQTYDPSNIPQTFAENGLQHRVLRPYQFTKEQFNFKQPAQLLRNYDLQTLGKLLSTSTTGSGPTLQTTKDYAATWWYNQDFFGGEPAAEFAIRVVYDYLDNEIERYFVLFNTLGTVAGSAQSYKIEASKGDGFKLTFKAKTSQSIPGGTLGLHIMLRDGVNPNNSFTGGQQTGFPTTGEWVATTNGWAFFLDAGVDSNEWHDVEIDGTINRVPFDGLLYILLDNDTTDAVSETHYTDIRLEYIALINQSTKIIGQTHTTTQNENIKLNDQDEIFIDDSPRNSIAGALFLPTMTGLLQDRTVAWYLNNGADQLRIGQLTTFEDLFWRRKVRSILEGSIRGLIPAETLGDHLSMLAVLNYAPMPDINFIFGRLEIDYKNNKASGTLYEIYDEGEVDGDLTATYEFKYLYAPK